MKINNKKGMTLVEMVMAIAIISIASLLLFTGLSTATKIIAQSHQLKEATNSQLASLVKHEAETGITMEEKESAMTLKVDGKEIVIDGTLLTAKSDESDTVMLSQFTVENTSISVYQQAYLDTIALFNELLVMSNSERVAYFNELKQSSGIDISYNYTGWMRNDDFRAFIYLKIGFIPLEDKIIEECNTIFDRDHALAGQHSSEAKAKLGDSKYYLKPYRIEAGDDAKEMMIMAAVGSNDLSTDGWRTSLLYNPDDQCWYYKVFASGNGNVDSYIQLSSLKAQGITWSVLKAQLQDPTKWQKLTFKSST